MTIRNKLNWIPEAQFIDFSTSSFLVILTRVAFFNALFFITTNQPQTVMHYSSNHHLTGQVCLLNIVKYEKYSQRVQISHFWVPEAIF